MDNHDRWLKMKETLQGYMWTMNSLMLNKSERILMFDQLSANLVQIDHYLNCIYVRFHTAQDGTLRFQIKKMTR